MQRSLQTPIMESLFTALIAALAGLAGFWLQSQLKKGEDFQSWFRDYYLDNGFNAVIVHLYSLQVNTDHIHHDFQSRRNAPILPLEALLRVSSLSEFPLLFDIIANGDRILRYRQDPEMLTGYALLLREIASFLVAAQQNLVSDPPKHRKQLRTLASRKSFQELHRSLVEPTEQFISLREVEFADIHKRHEAQTKAGSRVAGEVRRAQNEGKVPGEDAKVKEAIADMEALMERDDRELGQIIE